jgi:glucosamine--fructose-6-phosphate aminotransferase (isomerizing)
MPTAGHHTYLEITTQPDAWAETLEIGVASADALRALWRKAGGRSLLFTGCGSTYYLSLAAAALSRRRPAARLPASESLAPTSCRTSPAAS